MELKQIKELLANPDVRTIVEEQISKAVADKQAELDSQIAELNEQKKANEKKNFILKKTILAKSDLFERKLKELYEAKFVEAKKNLGKEVYEFINESVKNLTSAVQKDAVDSGKTAKMQEAFSTAMRSLAPFMDVNELVETRQEKITALESKVNEVIKQNKKLTEKAVKADIFELVIAECAGYPMDKQALILKTVQKMDPKSLTEAKDAVLAAKTALKKKEEEVVTESVETPSDEVVTENKAETQRLKLKKIGETIVEAKNASVTEEESEVTNATSFSYDFANL